MKCWKCTKAIHTWKFGRWWSMAQDSRAHFQVYISKSKSINALAQVEAARHKRWEKKTSQPKMAHCRKMSLSSVSRSFYVYEQKVCLAIQKSLMHSLDL